MSDSDDLKSHEEMWNLFTKMMLYGSIAVAALLLLMRIFLV
jgi:hypothetical protein